MKSLRYSCMHYLYTLYFILNHKVYFEFKYHMPWSSDSRTSPQVPKHMILYFMLESSTFVFEGVKFMVCGEFDDLRRNWSPTENLTRFPWLWGRGDLCCLISKSTSDIYSLRKPKSQFWKVISMRFSVWPNMKSRTDISPAFSYSSNHSSS